MDNEKYSFIFKISFVAYIIIMISITYVTTQICTYIFMLVFIIALIYQLVYLFWLRKKENIIFIKALKIFVVYAITTVSINMLIDYAINFIFGYTFINAIGQSIGDTYYGIEAITENVFKNIIYIPYMIINLIIIVFYKLSTKK